MDEKSVPVLFEALREHIEIAVSDVNQKKFILGEIQDLKNQIGDTTRVLDQLPVGIIVTNGHAEAVIVNRYAREVLNAGDGLSLVDGCLNCHLSKTTKQLKTAIASSTDDKDAQKRAFTLPRPSGAPPFMVLITSAGTGSAALFISNPERKPVLDHALISELFDLTRMEGIIAASVAQGQRLTDIAKSHNISARTARSHLRQVFAKTGTARQLDLANHIGSLLGKVRLGEDGGMANVVRLSNRKRRKGDSRTGGRKD